MNEENCNATTSSSTFHFPFAPHDAAIQIGWKRRRNHEYNTNSGTSNNSPRAQEEEEEEEEEVELLLRNGISNNNNNNNNTMDEEQEAEDITINSANSSSCSNDEGLDTYGNSSSPDNDGGRSVNENEIPQSSYSVLNSNEENDNDDNGTTIVIAPGVTLLPTSTMHTSMDEALNDTSDATMELMLQGCKAAVTIYGRYELQVKEGQLNILGYQMTPQTSPVTVENPKWLSAIVLQNNNNNNNKESSHIIIRNLCNCNSTTPTKVKSVTQKRGKQRVTTFTKTDAVYEHNYYYNYNNLDTLNPSKVRTTIQIPNSWEQAVRCCIEHIKNRHLVGQTATTMEDEDVIYINNNEDDDSKDKPVLPPKIVFCGAKGVGKSTLLRYTINRILSECHNHEEPNNSNGSSSRYCNTVAVLDCDLGQPEFSPPGIVSLTMVSQPILTPPHCHMMYGHEKQEQRQQHTTSEEYATINNNNNNKNYCERAYYFGYPTSKADPKTYLFFLSNLMKAYQTIINNNNANNNNDERCIPLVVNCDGWVKSMGRDILSTIIHDIVEPDHIIQIVGPTKSTSFELPTTNTYNGENNTTKSSSNRRIYIVEIFGSQDHPNNTQQQQTNKMNRPMLAPSVRPRDLRSLRLCTYFVGGPNELSRLGIQFTNHTSDMVIDPKSSSIIATHLASMVPYRVPFDSIPCHIIGNTNNNATRNNFTDEMIFDCMDGTIVGLGMDECGDEFMLCPFSCAGLGIVRSIDRKERILYVLTPIPFYQLQKVTVLFIGGGQSDLPLECLVPTPMTEAFPYLHFCGTTASSSSKNILSATSILVDD